MSERPDEEVSVGVKGQTVADVALGDLNGDDRNDLVALRSDGAVVIALGVHPTGDRGPYFGGTTALPMNGTKALGLGDVDRDGDLDVVVTATSKRIAWRANTRGSFGPVNYVAAGVNGQRLVLARLNRDNRADVAVSGDRGEISVLLTSRAGFAAAATYDIYTIRASTRDMPSVAGRLCPGHPTAMSLAMTDDGYVTVLCNDGTGRGGGELDRLFNLRH